MPDFVGYQLSGTRRLHAEALHFEVQAAPGQTEQAGRFRDISVGALEGAFDHLALELLDRGRK
jgi:hypothetical protein